MNDLPPTKPAPAFPGQPWALRLGAALVAAFVLIALLAFVDREARTHLEAAQDRGPVVGPR